jgi:hypothetical protein
MKVSQLVLKFNDADQLLIDRNSLFYGKRMLNPDAEEFIIEEASMASLNGHIHLKLHFRRNEPGRMDEIADAIHRHFGYRRKKSEKQLKKVLHLGWRSLLTSIVFFALLVALTFVLIRLLPEGRLSGTFQELLIILGWVVLWRPADLLLFDWRPIKRDASLFRKLELCKVEIAG